MYSIPMSRGRRGLRLASLALFGAALLSACDNDQAVAPKPAPTPAAAQPAVIPVQTGNLIWKVTDLQTQSLWLPGAKFKVTGPLLFNVVLTDNDPTDADKKWGRVSLTGLLPGSYVVCEISPPSFYALPTWPCHPTTVYPNTTTMVEKFLNPHLPRAIGVYKDHFGKYFGGGSFLFKDSTNATIMTVTDNSAGDGSQVDGWVIVTLPAPGKYTVCESSPPTGFAFPNGQVICTPFTVENDEAPVFYHEVAPVASANWGVTNGTLDIYNKYNPIGPSSFNISIPRTFTSIDVVDNGANDQDPALGKIYVTLPKTGVYTLCETKPPANHWIANPACRAVTVASGVPASAGWFINYEKQVPGARIATR